MFEGLLSPLPLSLLLLAAWWLLTQCMRGAAAGGGATKLPLESTLPVDLQRGDGSRVATAAALADTDYVLLYASAHWCPPCRAFTPVLSAWYSAHGRRLRVACVFVSMDRSATDFASYFSTMSWQLAVPWEQARDVSPALDVWGIPSLLLVDRRTGAVLTREGVSEVQADPAGARFPWRSAAALAADAAALAAAKTAPAAAIAR